MKVLAALYLFFFALLPFPVRATLVDLGGITRDFKQGIDWLHLTETVGLSATDALLTFPGWEMATNSQVGTFCEQATENLEPVFRKCGGSDQQFTGTAPRIGQIRGFSRSDKGRSDNFRGVSAWRDRRVCDKRFHELKPLYIDAFETLARLSVIAIGIEAIISHSSLEIPTKRGSLGLYEFEKLANANKVDHLSRYPIGDLFSPYLGTSLRNGIGHNAARYDSAVDEVVCVKQAGSALLEKRLHYTVFCDRVLELASILFHSEPYFFALLEETGGRLRSGV